MRISCLCLFPHSPKTQVPTHLNFSRVLFLLNFFTQQALYALENFYIHQNFHEFDPHVGEASCQIRAYQILLLSLELKKLNNHLLKVNGLKKILKKIKEDILFYEEHEGAFKKKSLAYTTLEDFITNSPYYFDMDEVDFFLIQSFILSKYKMFSAAGNPIINYESLRKDLKISRHNSCSLIHQYQIKVSEYSCDFLLDLTKKNLASSISYDLLKSLRYTDEVGRHILPCYGIMQVLLAHIKLIRPEILLVVERIQGNKYIDTLFLPFKVTSVGLKLKEKHHIQFETNPCFFIRGIVKYKEEQSESKADFIERLLRLGLEEVALLNMAAHPQYAGKNLNQFNKAPFQRLETSVNVDELLQLEKNHLEKFERARNLGCSVENPSLLLMVHICCDKLNRQAEMSHQQVSQFSSNETVLPFLVC